MKPAQALSRAATVALLVVTLSLSASGCGRVTTPPIAQGPLTDIGRTAVGMSGAVASVEGHATQVGIDVLQAGGNAIDAAVAVGFALAVTHPQAGNIGGGGFMVLYLADEDRFTTLDFREKAPEAASETMYLGTDGRPAPGRNRTGWLAVGVPGTVAGFELAHKRWGRLPWSRVVQPAVRLAAEGFTVDTYLAESFARVAEALRSFEGSREALLHADGSPYEAGETFVQEDLAESLAAIMRDGARAFYEGPIADAIARAMADGGGLITAEDLAAYRARERQPIRGTFRGHEIVSMGPPSSGGTILVEMLNILEEFDDLSELDAASPDLVHVMVEVARQAYLDRALHLGDADFVDVPTERLTAKEYASTLAAVIPRDRARSSASLGADVLAFPESEETTHFSVIDSEGNAVSTTYTIESGFGAKVVAPGTGFLLNNEMSDFNSWPGVTDERGYIGTDANRIAAGKRPLSSMTPTIVARDGRPVYLVGSPGGKTIINTVLRVVHGLLELELDLPTAVAAARFHHQWMPDVLRVEADLPASTVLALRALGHEVTVSDWPQGDAHCIAVLEGGARLAVADPRRSGAAAAY
jgi:gamma-glutamyltranspeptidase/glutathione hydrolase